jgi:membrane-associated phospholipid phosphatase
VVTEVLLLCYYGYFLWPLLLGIVLYRRGQQQAYQQYILALAFAFLGTFLGYIWMPAVGPRFMFADAYAEPLKGLLLTPWLDSAMRSPEFNRDCFPSGHTAITLVVLSFAFKYRRPFFWAVLPAAIGLIAATLVGRFHYGVDLLCALPLVFLANSAAMVWLRNPSPVARVSVALRAVRST